MSDKSVVVEKEKNDVVALPAKLYVSEAAKSAKKTEQERLAPDPNDAEWLKLVKAGLESEAGKTNDNS